LAETRSPFPQNCRVLIVSSQTLVREGLRLLLAQEEDLQVEVVVIKEDEVPEIQRGLLPDVILAVLDGVTQGPPELARLLEACQEIPVLVLSPIVKPDWVKPALAAGAAGYLPLDATPDELIHGVEKVSQGETVLHPSVILSFLSDLAGQSSRPAGASLEDFSAREQEVLAYLARGLSDREIGQSLFISVRTVQTHLENIYAKLGVHSRTEAAIIAVQSRWFPFPSPQNR
jgi:NarL family two-component system response regulator LiaR